MIDFRYHLVSLISVFVALSIGIVLGAGPLKEAIGDQLTGQVESLRADKEDLRAQLDDATGAAAAQDAFVAETADDLLVGVLPGRQVAIVELGDVADEEIEAITAQLQAAGAGVGALVTLQDNWTSEGQASFRQSLAGSLGQYLTGAPDGATTDQQLAAALAQSLTQVDRSDTTVYSEAATVLQELLVAGELVEISADARPADLILLVGEWPAAEGDTTPEETQAQDNEITILTTLARTAQQYAEAVVVVDVGEEPGALLAAVRDDADLRATVSTVAQGDHLAGVVSVPLVLSARASGTVGQYGVQPDATGIVPAVIRLAAVDRTPRMAPEPEDNVAGEFADETAQDETAQDDESAADADEEGSEG